MEFLFGKQKSPADRIKEYNRSIKKSVRELDRERNTLERQEKKLMGDIKKAAKDGQMDAAKIMAKDLVRTRAYIKKMHKMKSHMEAVSLRLQTMSSSQQMAQCMKGVTKAMGMMNRKVCTPGLRTAAHLLRAPRPTRPPTSDATRPPRAQMNLPQIQKIMMEFEKQNEMMGAPVPRSNLSPAGNPDPHPHPHPHSSPHPHPHPHPNPRPNPHPHPMRTLTQP